MLDSAQPLRREFRDQRSSTFNKMTCYPFYDPHDSVDDTRGFSGVD